MVKTTGRILKSQDIKLEGQYRLVMPQGGVAQRAPRPGAALVVPKVRLLESHADHALIEVTCSCGEKTILKCDYAGAQTPGDAQMQKGAGAAPAQTK